MSVKNDIKEFLQLYANLTSSKIKESEDLYLLELSPVEKRNHLLSQIKFSFSKEICERENAELLTVSNRTYQNILTKAKEIGVVVVAKSYQVKEPVIILNYSINMKCKNHINGNIDGIAFTTSDFKTVPIPTNWSEIDPSEAADSEYDITNFSTKIREALIERTNQMKFRFEDNIERRIDRERTIVNNYYEQLKKEREGATQTIEIEIKELENKIQNTKVMKVYESCKKKIKLLKRKMVELETSKAHDIEKIIKDHERSLKRIETDFKIETNINLLNALVVLPVKN